MNKLSRGPVSVSKRGLAGLLFAALVASTGLLGEGQANAAATSTISWSKSDVYESAGSFTLTSPDGTHTAQFQGDGNWVVYHGSKATWASNTANRGTVLVLASADRDVISDGLIDIYKDLTGPQPIWQDSQTPGFKQHDNAPSYRLTMQDDGNLVEYASDGTAMWASDTHGQ